MHSLPSLLLRLALPLAAALVVSFETANAAEPELGLYSDKVQNFLCQKSFCLNQKVEVEVSNLPGYFGYYHSQSQKVTLVPGLNEVQIQLNLAHEFTHAYRAKYNPNEELWLNEGLAKLMEYLYSSVWPVSYQSRLQQNPQILVNNEAAQFAPQGAGYASSFWLTLYLYKHYGGENFLKKVMRSHLSGWDNILHALSELKQEGLVSEPLELLTRPQIIRHFALAMLVNDAYEAKYSLFFMNQAYDPIDASKMGEVANIEFPVQTTGVIYSRRFQKNNADEVFAVRLNPLQIETATSDSRGHVFVYIKSN